jgi:hypothetical protein
MHYIKLTPFLQPLYSVSLLTISFMLLLTLSFEFYEILFKIDYLFIGMPIYDKVAAQGFALGTKVVGGVFSVATGAIAINEIGVQMFPGSKPILQTAGEAITK